MIISAPPPPPREGERRLWGPLLEGIDPFLCSTSAQNAAHCTATVLRSQLTRILLSAKPTNSCHVPELSGRRLQTRPTVPSHGATLTRRRRSTKTRTSIAAHAAGAVAIAPAASRSRKPADRKLPKLPCASGSYVYDAGLHARASPGQDSSHEEEWRVWWHAGDIYLPSS